MAGEELSFEEGLARLEQIVRELEGGNLSLERALEVFEEGVRLVRLCQEKLDAAEGKIKVLLEGEDGKAYFEELKEEDLLGSQGLP